MQEPRPQLLRRSLRDSTRRQPKTTRLSNLSAGDALGKESVSQVQKHEHRAMVSKRPEMNLENIDFYNDDIEYISIQRTQENSIILRIYVDTAKGLTKHSIFVSSSTNLDVCEVLEEAPSCATGAKQDV